MYHMTPEEIRQRFLLLEWIDGIIPFVILGYAVPWLILSIIRHHRNPMVAGCGHIWRDVEWKIWGYWTVLFTILDLIGHLLILSVFVYFIWRTFYAFY